MATWIGAVIGGTAAIALLIYMMRTRRKCRLTLFPERNPNPVLCLNHRGEILYANRSADKYLSRLNLDAHDYKRLLPNGFETQLKDLTTFKQGCTTWEYTINTKSFEARAYYFSDIRTFHLYLTDVTQKKAAEDELVHQAYHDTLTSLPNQRMLDEHLHDRLITRRDQAFVLIVLKIGHTSPFEGELGSGASDNLILRVTRRLNRALRQCGKDCGNAQIYRIENYKFVILHDEMPGTHVPVHLIEAFNSCFDHPFTISGHQHVITYNIGMAFYPDDAEGSEMLLRNANSALNQAHKQGNNNFVCYSPEMNAMAIERLTLENDLRKALANREFMIHYQPKVRMKSRKLVGAEALLRWNHPIGGEISPEKFIALAEEIDFIIPISEWLLEEVCHQIDTWKKQGLEVVPVAINVSPKHFVDDTLPASVKRAIDRAGIDPALVELEITEGVTVHNVEEAIETLTALKALGVSIAIDDFGTGYSSLAYLQQLPLDTLKIDQSFVRRMGEKGSSTTIVKAIIGLAHNLGLELIAEGVETQEQYDLLRQFGCQLGQGFLFSRPVPAEDFARIMELEALDKKSP